MIQSFENVQQKYKELREDERKSLSSYLTENIDKQIGLEVEDGNGAGKGRKYKSGNRIVQYDLSNWKWVELKGTDNSFNCIISLNMYEVDPNSANFHALFDRIGLYITYKIEHHYYQTQIYTDIDLPLNDEKKEQIKQLALDQFKFFRTHEEIQQQE